MITRLRSLVAVFLLRAIVGTAGVGLLISHPAMAAPAQNIEHADIFDINTAAAEQLKVMSGISDAYSEKVIMGRPHQRKDALVQKKVIPRAIYEQIKQEMVAKQK